MIRYFKIFAVVLLQLELQYDTVGMHCFTHEGSCFEGAIITQNTLSWKTT